MQPADWNNYLSSNNPWTARLLGLEVFSKTKSIEEIEREYNQEKYGKLLKFDFTEVSLYKLAELEIAGVAQDSNIFASFKESLFEIKLSLAMTIYNSIIFDAVNRYNSQYICELGCGYGYNLAHLESITSVYGGEFSQNAVAIGKKLGFDITNFNFYEREGYRIIKPGSAILTIAGVVCLPSAKCFIDGLYENKDNIDVVINFEPLLLKETSSLVETLRRQYIEINDYNRDLFSMVMNMKNVEVIEFQRNCIGLNPLLPSSLLVWKFK